MAGASQSTEDVVLKTSRWLLSARVLGYIDRMLGEENNVEQNFWAPLYWPTRAAVVLLGHVVLGGLLVTCIWGTARYIHWLYEPQGLPKLYGQIPLEWAFDTMDAGVFGLFLVWGLIEANRELRRR